MADYQLFTDKMTVFECKVEVEGVSIKDASARIVLERADDVSLLFKGNVARDGTCSIPISKLRGLMQENESGTMRLEVIAEDVYFPVWESSFKVVPSKKVAITEVSKTPKSSKPTAKIVIKEEISPKAQLIDSVVETLRKNAVSVNNIREHRALLREAIAENLDRLGFDVEPPKLISEIVTSLARWELNYGNNDGIL